MSIESEKLSVGDYAMTEYNSSGSRPAHQVRVQIVAVDRFGPRGRCQSGVMFQVRPLLNNGTPDCWYDADWFVPAPHHMPPNDRANRPDTAAQE